MGGDPITDVSSAYLYHFNSRHPCGWRLREIDSLHISDINFNSRHPCGWRPSMRITKKQPRQDFNSRHPCGWRHPFAYSTRFNLAISTHATHVGGDPDLSVLKLVNGNFNSRHPCGWRLQGLGVNIPNHSIFQLTPPMWVATRDTSTLAGALQISTHATHVGGDLQN